MKKIIFLLVLFIACQAQAQQAVVFKMKYLPGHNYNGDVTILMNCNITVSGDQKILDQLKSQGMSQPIALNVAMKMKGVTTTGTTGANNIFPLSMSYKMDTLSGTINGNAIPMPVKTTPAIKIYGHVGADGKLVADSLGGKSNDTAQQKMTQLINTFQNKIKFPDHPLRVGDTFTQDMPFNLPIAGSSMAANGKATYKLVNIADGKAYFDITQNMDMKIPIKSDSITLSGAGTGKLVYDIKNSFPTDFKANITLKFDGKITTVQIDGTVALNMEYSYVIN